jgi:hypothetical protein
LFLIDGVLCDNFSGFNEEEEEEEEELILLDLAVELFLSNRTLAPSQHLIHFKTSKLQL